jgi:hypothetical protein
MSEAGAKQNATDAAPAAAGHSFVERFVGALRLDGSVYEEIAGDPGALAQAAGVAAIAAAARAIGVLSATTSGEAVLGALHVLALWPIVALLIWSVGSLLRSPGEFGRVLRVVGFAMAPLVLVVLLVVPNDWFRGGVGLVTYALLFGALVVAVRAALRIDTGRAAFVCMTVAMAVFFLILLERYFAIRSGH